MLRRRQDGNRAAYKIALHWPTDKRIWTCSKDIEQAIEPEENEPEDLPIVIEFIGAYPYWDLPTSVVRTVNRSRCTLMRSTARMNRIQRVVREV